MDLLMQQSQLLQLYMIQQPLLALWSPRHNNPTNPTQYVSVSCEIVSLVGSNTALTCGNSSTSAPAFAVLAAVIRTTSGKWFACRQIQLSYVVKMKLACPSSWILDVCSVVREKIVVRICSAF